MVTADNATVAAIAAAEAVVLLLNLENVEQLKAMKALFPATEEETFDSWLFDVELDVGHFACANVEQELFH